MLKINNIQYPINQEVKIINGPLRGVMGSLIAVTNGVPQIKVGTVIHKVNPDNIYIEEIERVYLVLKIKEHAREFICLTTGKNITDAKNKCPIFVRTDKDIHITEVTDLNNFDMVLVPQTTIVKENEYELYGSK